MFTRCLVSLLLLGSLNLAAAAQSVATVAAHAPADSHLAVVSGDVAATCQEFQATRVGQMLCGPDLVPLIDELRRRDRAGPLHLQPAFGFDWKHLQTVRAPGGMFVFPLAKDQQGAAWIFAGSPSTEASAPLTAAAQYFQGKGFSTTAERRAGATLTVFRPPANKSDEAARVQFVAGGFYGLANSPEAAAAVLSVAREQSLASTALWQQSAPDEAVANPRPGDVALFLRPMEFWERMRRSNESREAARGAAKPAPAQPGADAKQAKEPQPDALASSRQLGFDGLQAVVGRVTFPAEAMRDWEIRTTVVAPRPFTKALRLLEFQAGPMPQLPDWISAELTSVSFWRWDFPTAMQGFGNLFDEANEPGPDGVGLFEDMLDGLRDDPEGVQVDLRKEVFARMGPGILNVTDRRGPRTKRLPDGDRTLYMAQVREIDQVADALTRFYRGDDRVTSERIGNYQVWTVPEGASLFVEGESDSVVSVRALALGENRMLFGTDVELLRVTASGDAGGTRLSDDPAWTRLWDWLKQRHGATAALWSLAQLDQVLEPSYARAISPEYAADQEDKEQDESFAGGLWRVLLFGTADKEVEVPLAAAPAYSRVKTALTPAGIVMTPHEQGWIITVDALRDDAAP